MTNAEKFKRTFGLYATELWAKPEKEFLEWLNADADINPDDIRFYVPKDETIPTDLRLYVGGVYVDYWRTDSGFRFSILLDDENQAMKIAEKIVERMKFEHDEPEHGISWRTKSLFVVHQEERYEIGTIIDWEFYVRDSY